MSELARTCCLDLDTFFVSVERLLDPSLIGKPVVIGGRRFGGGVVTACSYEVRTFGVHSGMSIREASHLAPQAIFMTGTHGVYGDYSRKAREIIERFSPVVRAASIDEHYIDFHGCERLYRRPGDGSDDATVERVVREMTAAIHSELGLPASAGIATSKAMAKVASGMAKPEGVLLVPAGSEAATLAPLSVRKYPGIGPAAEQRLREAGIATLGELANAPGPLLRRVFGSYAEGIRRGARGLASSTLGRERPAFREYDPKGGRVGSISNERTFAEDPTDPTSSEAILCALCERVCWRARKRGVKARTVTLKLRYSDFHTVTRGRTLAPTNCDATLWPALLQLYRSSRVRSGPIRLLGVALSKLDFHNEQLELFEGRERMFDAVDSVRSKYGFDALRLARASRKRVGAREA